MNIHTTHNLQKGFTIIETLVAITILMIAIAGPLTIANQALHAAQDAKNQMVASNLAQEAVEEIRNYKDVHIGNGSVSSVLGQFATAGFWGVQETPSSSAGYLIGLCSTLGNPGCNLYLNASSGYTYDTSGTPTPFTRTFVLQPVSGDPDEYMLTVTVAWTTGTVPNQVRIQEILATGSR